MSFVAARRSSVRRCAQVAVAGSALACASLLGASPAFGHVSPDKGEVPAGSSTEVRFGVGHGCDGSPTNKIEIQVPASINSVTPYAVPGWTGEVTKEALDTPVTDAHGAEITERDSVVTWTAQAGNELPDHWKIQFVLGFTVPDAEGETLSFPTIQTCQEGSTNWTEATPESGEEPENPAPVVKIVASTGEDDGHGAESETTEAAGDDHQEASGDATAAPNDSGSDSDSDDGGSKGIAIAGLVAGLAGLGLGGAAFAKGRKG